MLRFVDSARSRREFLRVGSLGLGGLALSSLLAAKQGAAADGGAVKDKAVVFLFLHGGPPQQEMFDPKMTAPGGVRSVTGERTTTVPGVTYGGTLEKLSRLAHRVAIVRSFQTGDGNHDIKPIVGRDSLGANLGSLWARVAGTNDPATGLPRNVALYPQAIDPSTQPTTMAFGRFESTGPLGASYAPFVAGSGGELQKDLTLSIPRGRLEDRRLLLERLDGLRRSLEGAEVAGVDRIREQAFDAVLGGVADAFDLSQEDPRTVERYDTSGLIDPRTIRTRWNNHQNYKDHVATLGKLLLLARRLCERGAGFVTITTNFVWDMHADINNATIEEGMRYCALPFDHAVSAFIEDVEERGLSDRILLVTCGEMGRTPRVNQNGGRDHWGGLAPLLLAGGGLPMGQVIGRSNAQAAEPDTEPVTIPNLIATIYSTLFDIGALRLVRGLPPEILRAMTAAKPIAELS